MLFQESYRQSSTISMAHLLGEEIINSAKTQDLGELAGITKGVWQPRFSTSSSECIFKVTLTVKVLTGKRFPGRYHTVVFDPGSSYWGESTLDHVLGNPFERLGIKLLQPDIMLGRGSSKSVIWESIHEVTLGAPAPSDLLMRLRVSP